MKNTLTDKGTFLEAQSIAECSTGGWTSKLKGIKPRTKWFKSQFCGHVLRPDLSTINPN